MPLPLLAPQPTQALGPSVSEQLKEHGSVGPGVSHRTTKLMSDIAGLGPGVNVFSQMSSLPRELASSTAPASSFCFLSCDSPVAATFFQIPKLTG